MDDRLGSQNTMAPLDVFKRHTTQRSEKEEEERLDMSLRKKEKINKNDVNMILMNLINRKRFIYSARDILNFLMKCICLRKLGPLRKNSKYKKHFIYNKGQ